MRNRVDLEDKHATCVERTYIVPECECQDLTSHNNYHGAMRKQVRTCGSQTITMAMQ